MEHVLHILAHGTLDSLKLLPFLFVTYLLMELLEHKAGDRVQRAIARAGKAGPAIGGALGLVPQCGFSAMAAGLYAGHIITPGTLLAVFLATSDEMLPIFLGEGIAPARIFTVLALKLGCALIVGFVTDLLLRKHIHGMHISELCEDEHCHCEKGILRSAIHHTLHIFGIFSDSIGVTVTICTETFTYYRSITDRYKYMAFLMTSVIIVSKHPSPPKIQHLAVSGFFVHHIEALHAGFRIKQTSLVRLKI